MKATLRVALLLAAGGLGCTNGAIVLGEGLRNEPSSMPSGLGGGPPPEGICHPSPGELGEPSRVPEGFAEPDHSDTSPAHPPHLRQAEQGRRWIDRL